MISMTTLKSNRRRIAGYAGAGALAVAMSLALGGSAANSQTVTPQSVDPVQHFFDCLGVLITDGEAHAAYCSPGQPGPDGSIYSMQGTSSCSPVFDDTSDEDADFANTCLVLDDFSE